MTFVMRRCYTEPHGAKMDDSFNDFDYLNDIRDTQMLYRAPRRQFERFDPLEYYDENGFVERFRFTKTEIRRLEEIIRHRLEDEHVNRGTNITPME